MHEVDKFGISSVMDQVCDYFKEKDNIHLSLDIDAMDPFFAPHTGTAVRGGLTFREGNYLCEALCATNKLTSMDLVELNPMIGATGASEEDTNETIEMGLTLIGSAMGQRIL
jgi:arginase